MNRIVSIIICIICISCNNLNKESEIDNRVPSENENIPIPDSIKQDFSKHLMYTLQGVFQISPGENYKSSVLDVDYNGDGIQDKIITINRLEKANFDLKNHENPAKMLEMGQMGNYNHFIIYNGKDSSFNSPVTIPSSPYLPLSIHAIALQNDIKSELQVDYRIRNAAYRAYYTIYKEQTKMVFQWKLFDGLGTNDTEAYSFDINNSGISSNFKDIIIYKADLENLPKNENANTFNPKCSRKGPIFTTFFYLDKEGKYFTKQKINKEN